MNDYILSEGELYELWKSKQPRKQPTEELPYTLDELYDLWLGFRSERDATRMLADFALCGYRTAYDLVETFETRRKQAGRG